MRREKPTKEELILEFNKTKNSLVHGLSPLFPSKLESGWSYDLYLSNEESLLVILGKLFYYNTDFAAGFPLYEYNLTKEEYEQMTNDLPKKENNQPMAY